MLLNTYYTLMIIFLAALSVPHLINQEYKVLSLIASIGLIITGLTMLADGRGLVIEDGRTIITENKTGGDTETTQTIQYESIGSFITQLLQLSTLLGGLALFYTQFQLFYGKEDRPAWSQRL